MKKTFALILAAMLGITCLSGCGTDKPGSAENHMEKPAEKNNETALDWADIYTNFIIENEDEFTEEAQPTIAYIGVNDLNFDGTPELIVSGTVASAAYYFDVFQIQNGAVEKIDLNQYTFHKLSLYSHFFDGWITVRKNKNDGSRKYVILSSNGSSEESFGNVISICQDPQDSSKLKITNEFEYVEYWETPENSKYYVAGAEVSGAEYKTLHNEFDEVWQYTGIENYAMLDPSLAGLPDIYSKTVPMSLEKEDLKNFFAMYQPEK